MEKSISRITTARTPKPSPPTTPSSPPRLGAEALAHLLHLLQEQLSLDLHPHLTTGNAVLRQIPRLNSSASISPDGTKVAMILSKGGSPDLWVSNIDGSV
jgi:hypothetical protein